MKLKDLLWTFGFSVFSIFPGIVIFNYLEVLEGLFPDPFIFSFFFSFIALELPMVLSIIFALIYFRQRSFRFQMIAILLASIVSYVINWFLGPDKSITDACSIWNGETNSLMKPDLSQLPCMIHTLVTNSLFFLAWLWILTLLLLGIKKLGALLLQRYSIKLPIPSWPLFIIMSLILFVVTFISYPFIIYAIHHRDDPRVEKETEQEIREIVSKHPEMTIDRLVLWEGDSTDTISIKDKGNISFWYRKGGHPLIESIILENGKVYSTNFMCEQIKGGKREYAYDYTMEVTKDAPLGHLFNFEIKTISDLSTRFDDLVKTLDTFPRIEETVTLTDRSGTRDFIKNPDPKYSFKTNYSEKADCYHYVRITNGSGEPWKN